MSKTINAPPDTPQMIWSAKTLFDYYKPADIANLLREETNATFLSSKTNSELTPDAGPSAPSYLAMLDQTSPAGKLIVQFGHVAWDMLTGACRVGKVSLPTKPHELEKFSRHAICKFFADLWYWQLFVWRYPNSDVKNFPGVSNAFDDLNKLRKGELLFGLSKEIPKWDANERTLSFDNRVLKKYRKHSARNQVGVLEAFEEAGWTNSIKLPVRNDQIRDTVRGLNNSLGEDSPIRFSADGTGTGIRWDKV